MSALAVVGAVLLVYALAAIFIYGRGLLYSDADAAALPSTVRRGVRHRTRRPWDWQRTSH